MNNSERRHEHFRSVSNVTSLVVAPIIHHETPINSHVFLVFFVIQKGSITKNAKDSRSPLRHCASTTIPSFPRRGRASFVGSVSLCKSAMSLTAGGHRGLETFCPVRAGKYPQNFYTPPLQNFSEPTLAIGVKYDRMYCTLFNKTL